MLASVPDDVILIIIQYLSNVEIKKLSHTFSRLKRLDLYTLDILTKDVKKLPSLIRFINNTKIKISLSLFRCKWVSDVSPLNSVTNLDL